MVDSRYPCFWSDDFDMDLPKVLPRLDEALADLADTSLWTHGGESHGRLNHPSVWGARNGLGSEAFFGTTAEATGKPDWYYTSQPVIECTWREAVRDAWPHTYTVLVDSTPVWSAGRWLRHFNWLMFDLRGWSRLPDGAADRLRGEVLASLHRATADLRQVLALADPPEVPA